MNTNMPSNLEKYLNASEDKGEERGLSTLLEGEDRQYGSLMEEVKKYKSLQPPSDYDPFQKIYGKKRARYRYFSAAAAITLLFGLSWYLFIIEKGSDIDSAKWTEYALEEKLELLRTLEHEGDVVLARTDLKEILEMESDINVKLYIVDILVETKETITMPVKVKLLENENNPLVQVAMIELFDRNSPMDLNTDHLTGMAIEKLKKLGQ
jgi:hypothetical protein